MVAYWKLRFCADFVYPPNIARAHGKSFVFDRFSHCSLPLAWRLKLLLRITAVDPVTKLLCAGFSGWAEPSIDNANEELIRKGG